MLKWLSGEEGAPGSKGPGSPRGAAGGDVAVEEMTERLTQTEQLVTQLKELIREKDAALHAKDDQLKVEKEACEAKLSKLRLQNKAKVTSLSNQLEELKKQQSGQGTPTHSKKGSSEADQASRGKIVLLKKKVEELEQQVAQRDEELDSKRKMLESQRQRGEEMDAMLTEKNRKLAEKEAYIVHLQTALAGDQPVTPAPQQKVAEDSGAMAELQLLVQSLTRKVGEAEERYSLLQEQTDSLRELLSTEKEQYGQKETMYEQNIQTFKDIILQKDNQLTEINQMHEQELFRLAAKSDASADLEQLLKALKQKLHEKEEVLLGKTQVIDVLQGEVDGRDQQIKELTERLRRLQVERESLESKMEAEKHVMRAQLRDLMEKQQAEVQRLAEQHQAQVNHLQQDLLDQLEVLRKTSPTAPAARQEEPSDGQMFTDSMQRIAELEAQAKQKSDEASRSEAKFLKMKAWSKSRIRQLEEELKKSQAGGAAPDLTALRSRVTALEEEREENLWKVEQYEELKMKNDMLEAKLVVYEEQQRTLQADLEQFTKRAASQASESGSADDAQSQVLEWQEMVAEAASARDRAREEKAAMVLRISHMDEEREALATRQQELEEELAQARGLGHHRAKKLAVPSQRSLQDDFEFDGQAPFQDSRSSESTTPMEGENMGGGLRSVVEELELERNQLQEQILSLEERCQDLEEGLQLQARIETLQNECEKLQSQLASVRSQQSRDAAKHQLLVNSLNEQLKGLNDTQECLESSLIEKENALAKTSEKLELISSLRDSLSEKETQYKDVSEKLSQTELTLENVSKKCSSSEKQCSELKTEVSDLLQKLSVLKERTQKQEVIIETLQTELDQTNEELDKLNTTHLEERAQFIHDLQSCEREIDSLKDILLEKDKEISSLSGNMAEYAEQVTVLKQEIRLKEEHLVHVERALSKAEQEAVIIRDSQTSDQQALNSRITELVGKLRDNETELVKSKEDRDSKVAEVENLIKQVEEDKKTIQDLREEIQKQSVSHRSHRSECEMHITSLKEQLALSAQKLQESEGLVSQLKDKSTSNEKLQQQLDDTEQTYEKERKAFKEEHNKLVSQVEKYNGDIQTLSKQLEERVQREEHIKKEIRGKLETIASLENQLKAKEQQAENERQKFNSELQVRDSENHKLSSELQSKSESVSKLKNALKGLKTEKQELQDNLKGLNEELELQKNCAKELQDKVTSALELNSRLESQIHSLTQDKQTLERTVAESRDAVCEVTAEKESLLAKISTLETQHSQNATFLEGLQKDKEELTLRNNELSRGLEHSTHSNSEVLLAKTNECSQLSQLLRQSEDKVTHLQEQVQRLTSAVAQLQHRVADKEQTVANLQSQRTHLQETLSHLQEQECRLKSAMAEKQDAFHRLQNELSAQNSVVSKLQAEADLLCEERSQLRQQVEHKEELLQNLTQQCHKHKDELDETNKTIKALSGQLGVMEENARRLEAEAEIRTTELLSLNSRFHSVTEENQQLRAACESREKELARETQLVSDLHSQLEAALEQNSGFSVQISSLTADNQRLQEELAHNIKSICEVTRERTLLQEKNRGLESQISDNQKTIEGLMKTNEELTFAADEITKILKETEKSNSAGLLEKTSECANLSKMLREREEQLQNLQEQVEGSKMEVSRLYLDLNERERMVLEQSSQLEAQQNQLLQLQDTISMLQEQGSVLKSGLMEKDAMCQQKAEECSVYEKELQLHKDLLTQMQAKCLEATKQVERKEQELREVTHEFHSHKDELSKRNESVLSLSSQLGAMNESAAATEAELSDLKAAVEKVTAENSQLSQEMSRSKAEVADFNDCVQALNEQNAKLKSELQKTVTALSRAQGDVSDLKAAVGDLENELKTTRSEKELIHLTVQGKDESLKQQEALVQQLSSTVAVQDEQMKQKERDHVSLTAKVSELEDCVSKLRSQVDALSLESFTLKDTLEKKEQSRLEDQSHSAAEVESLTSSLHAKEEECESFKEQISHLEESLSKLNSTLQIQAAEVETLKKAMEEKETALLDRSRSLQDARRRADEALLFKSQFMESTESVSRLQSRIQSLSTESENLRRSAEETQSAFNNLQEKYAANLEELQDVKKQLSQQSDEVSNLRRLLDSSRKERQVAHATIETLSSELEVVRQKLRETEDRNSSLSTEKEEAFASHQASVSVLTVEIERLKAQHLQVVAQMNALTENLEQREMALHAINSQYTAQAKRASQLVSEIQKLEEQNKRLNEEISLSKDEHQGHLNAVRKEDARLQQEVTRLRTEKEELEQRHHQIRTTQGDLQLQMEQQSSSMNQVMSEKESLQAKVSAKDEELSELRENIQKVEQVLQDSEKEWLLVLDREKQHKNLLAEQLRSVENEMKAKDLKVIALKQDLDSLHEKLVEASSAVRQGSDQLSAKELEASASRIQLEKVLATVQEKEDDNNTLQQTLKTVELELHKLLIRKTGTDEDSSASPDTSSASLQDLLKQLGEAHKSEVDALNNDLGETVAELQQAQKALNEGERTDLEQLALLQESVELLQSQLKAETEKVKEAAVKHSTLHSESRAKDEQISCMSIQISQQKELLAGLSQQLRDKDASIAQVMEAASNERMKLSEDKMSLIAQLERTEQAHASSMKGLEDVSQQLEERLLILQTDVETKNSEKCELIMRNEDLNAELATVTKDKEALKKKLQAALILRKDLLKKLEQSENQREEGLNDERQKLEEVTSQAQVAENAHQEQVAFLEKNILEKEAEILELKMQSERVVKQAEALQTALNEKETRLSEISRTLDEKNTAIEQLQSVSAEQRDEFERERNKLLHKLEELQSEVKSCKDELKEKSSSAAAVVDLESELTQMKSEKATLQKKAQAALVARKETMKKAQEREKKLTQELAELKDDYKALLEQHCQQTNELNAVQFNFDENVKQLEERHKACLSHRDEVDTLRQLVEERDKTLQDLKMTLAEKESQCHALFRSHTEMENLTSTFHSMSLELTNKDEALSIAEQNAETLKSKLQMVENELEKAHVELRQKTEDVGRYQEAVRGAEQEKDLLLQPNTALKTTQEPARAEEKYEALVGQKEALSAQCRLMKAELDAAVALVTQKSLEMSAMQKTSAEKQQRLSDDLAALIEELEKAKLRCTETENSLDLLKQDKDDAVRLSDELRDEVVSLKTRLKEAEELNQQQRTPETSFVRETPPPCDCAERVEVQLKEKDAALTGFQTQLSEKEELVAALESQLQQQIQMHETVVQKMRADTEALQRESTSVTDQDNQSKIALLTRKLQAALVSRKELKEEVEKLSAKHKAKETEVSALESSVLKLEKLNMDLEGSVSSLNREKVQLGAEVERVLHENRSLSAACDSLKLTIESITQQKQAFSCQLESLKDSQTEELSKWKSEHAELKQEYESLLQAYENVSSEMDKMRQLVEGAKRDRQEALRKMHKYEGELKTLERQAREREEENESMKDRMRQFSKEKRQKIEELEEESQDVRRELTEMEGKHKMATAELTDQQQRLEAEICQMSVSTEELRLRLTELQAENSQLAENLEEANSSLKRKYLESSTYTSSMQLKLDEALSLNNSLTAQIEAQNTELGAQLEINKVLQKEKENLSERIEKIQNDSEFELGKKDDVIKELQRVITKHSQETISLNEKVRILEDDKCLLQEELENVQEISDKVKNENEYLETVILKNSERIDELTESVNVLQSQNTQLSTQLAASKDVSNQVRHEKEEEQLKLVREFEQKLKDLQRGNEGSKNVKRELQELLKEKHQEINQLQQNCIKCQELILDLESSLKSSQSDCEQLEKEQKKSAEKISVLEATNKCVEAELRTHKKLLQEATEQMAAVQSERERLAAEVSQQRKRSEARAAHQATTTADENQISPYVENESALQRQIEELTYLKDQESQKLDELKRQLDSRDLQVNTLKRAAETSEAKLCALSSTPQGADATNLWNDLYQKTLHEKDNQLLEQGFVIKRFLEDMRAKDKDVNELRVTKSRLERTLNEYSVAAAAQQRQLFVLSASNAELSESVELLSVQVKELSARAERTEQERNVLMRQLADKDGTISQMQLNLQQTEKINADTDAQLLLVQSQKDKLQADFEKQEGISLQLRALLQSKDAEISSLLSCKDGQMSGYLEQLQANYRSQVAVYEDRLTSSRYQREKADKELRTLEAKMKSLQIKGNKCAQEKEQMAAKMESFKNSMVSLQSERERLTSEYRILEAKSELVLKGKEGSADEGGAAKGLKHEIRKLLHQMDDLNSENAMLRAQLVRYREDLNQVLSLKDNQLKVLLKKQQDAIKTLEHQKAAAEKQSRESRLELQKEEEASAALKAELCQLQAQVATLRDEILSQKKERSSTSEGRVIVDLQEAVAAKAAECSDLQQKLLSDKILTDELTEKLHMVGNETDKKLAAAEEKYNSELDAFEREVELMRSEREAADQRLAELAKDLLETEQQLSEARMQRQDLKDQNESLCKAMAALQNDRDQLIENFKILRNRYDEELRESQAAFNKVEQSLQDASSDLAAFSKERDLLVHKLKAVESKDPQTELNKLVDELSKALSSKEKELKQVALENNTYGRQLSAFSRSMASLQNDRDRLMDELVRVKRAVESWPGSRPEAVASGHTSGGRQSEEEGPKMEELQQDVPPAKESSGSREEVTALRSDREEDAPAVKESVALLGGSAADDVRRLEAERVQLHRDLQRCMYEIQQRDQYFQQLSTKLQQTVEEKGAVSAQLRAVSQTLRDTQDRCHWLEGQLQGQAQGSAFAEVAPGAPQERSNVSVLADAAEATQLRDRLREVELSLTDERARRESAEEALRLAEDRAKGLGSRDGQRDFSIEMEAEEEWEALSLNPNQPLIRRKVKGGMVTCRRWLRGRSLYFSRLLTSRARSRYFFLAYLLTIHVLVVMCLTGAL